MLGGLAMGYSMILPRGTCPAAPTGEARPTAFIASRYNRAAMATAQTLQPEAKPKLAARPNVRLIAKEFDRASRAARVPFGLRVMYWLYYLGLAHRGKPVYSATLDTQYEDGFFRRGYEKYRRRIHQLLEDLPPQASPLEIPSFQKRELSKDDLAFLRKKRIPFVIRGAAKGLPMMQWDLDYLDRIAGDCEVPVNAAQDKPSKDLNLPTKSHHYYDFHVGTVKEVTDSIRQGGDLRLTVAEAVMHRDNDRLLKDVDVSYWETLTGWDQNQKHWLRSKLFVGKVFSTLLLVQPDHAYSLWHTEPGDAFFALSNGAKTWTMAHPKYTAAMVPRVKKTTNYTGANIDIRESDAVIEQRGFRAFLRIPKVAIRMEAGDVLRVPHLWWHTVETHRGDYTTAVSMRIEPGPTLVGGGFLLLGLFDRQARAVYKAYQEEGRISDTLIGQPRKSRSQQAS